MRALSAEPEKLGLRRPNRGRIAVALLAAATLVLGAMPMAWPAEAQPFQLRTSDGAPGGTAVLSRTGLVITDRAGAATRYDREPRYDSADQRYLGFIDRQTDRALRFPADGEGVLQWADLRAARPQFTVSHLRASPLPATPLPATSLAPRPEGIAGPWRPATGIAPRSPYPPPRIGPPRIGPPIERLISQRVVPNPPLPPAEVLLTNSHHQDLYVVIADLRSGHRPPQLTVPAGGAVSVVLERDAGGTAYQTYEVRSPRGVLAREERVTPIPPSTLYDISVYERFLQSIAIDRTGKSPDVIEDIHYEPRSVGIFPLPAGAALADGATVDVWAAALAAGNPGGVRPVRREPSAAKRIDPLRRALEEATR